MMDTRQELVLGYWREVLALPQASVEVVAGSSHFPHVAHPDTFAELLALTGRWL